MHQDNSSKQHTDKRSQSQGITVLKIGIQLFFVFFLVFFVSNAWYVYRDMRVAEVSEFYVAHQRWMAEGNLEKVWTAESGIFFRVTGAGTFALMREFSSPEAADGIWLTQHPYYVLSVYDQGRLALVAESERRLYQLDLTTYVPTFYWDASILGEDCRILSADRLANGELLIGLELNGEQVIYVGSPEGELAYVAAGIQPTAHPTQPRFYYVRDHLVYAFNLANSEETIVAAGEQVAVSQQGSYLSVVGAEGIMLLQEKNPHDSVALSYADSNIPQYSYLSSAWDREDTLYVVRATTQNLPEVIAYKLGNATLFPEKVGALWVEGRVDGDKEAMARVFPQDSQLTEAADFRDTILGYQISDHGMHQQGQYVLIEWQTAAEGKHGFLQQRIYLEGRKHGYEIMQYLNEELVTYAAEANVLYEEKKGKQVPLGDLPEEAEVFAYNPAFKKYLYVIYNVSGWNMVLVDSSQSTRAPKYFELPLPAEAEMKYLAFNEGCDLVALNYNIAGQTNVALFDLGASKWVETPFLNDVERVYWRENDLIVFKQKDELSFRWRYNPWHGYWGLDML